MQSEAVLQDSPVMPSEMVPENNPVLQTVQLLIVNPDGTVNMTYCNDLHSLASGGMEISPEREVSTEVIMPSQTVPSVDESVSRSSRKRKHQPELWKQAIRKNKRQSGEEYVNSKGKLTRARSVNARPTCYSCRFKCCEKVSTEQRTDIHSAFWAMSDSAKNCFFEQTTKRVIAKRRSSHNAGKKKFSYRYYLTADNVQVRVCKKFYFSCLDVSQRRISYYHEQVRDSRTGTARPDKRGQHKKKVVQDSELQLVMDHINSFPRVQSHYHRAKTSREYMEAKLNLAKMYD